MTQTAVNYGKALLCLGVEPEEMEQAAEIFEKVPQLFKILSHPMVPMGKKEAVINQVFSGKLGNFFKVLCKNQDLGQLKEIQKVYKECWNEKNHILTVKMTYAEPPKQEQLEGIKDFLCREFHTDDVDMQMEQDKRLLGGFTLRTGSSEIDWSLKGRILQLQQKLVGR